MLAQIRFIEMAFKRFISCTMLNESEAIHFRIEAFEKRSRESIEISYKMFYPLVHDTSRP